MKLPVSSREMVGISHQPSYACNMFGSLLGMNDDKSAKSVDVLGLLLNNQLFLLRSESEQPGGTCRQNSGNTLRNLRFHTPRPCHVGWAIPRGQTGLELFLFDLLLLFFDGLLLCCEVMLVFVGLLPACYIPLALVPAFVFLPSAGLRPVVILPSLVTLPPFTIILPPTIASLPPTVPPTPAITPTRP